MTLQLFFKIRSHVIVITHPWGLYLICKHDARGWSVYKSDTTEWMCYNCFVLWCVSGSKAPLASILHKEWFYTASPVPQDSVGGLADGKPWVFMLLSRNGFTMQTHTTFLVFRISTNVPLALLTSWLLALYAWSVLYIMVNWMCMAVQWLSARPSFCIL